MNGASLIHPDFSYHFNPSAVKLFIPRINNKVPFSINSDYLISSLLLNTEYKEKVTHEPGMLKMARVDAILQLITSLPPRSLCGIPSGVWETGKMTLRLNREHISYVRFILEGYDGLGIVTTTDPVSAEVVITYPLGRESLLRELVGALAKEGVIREERDQ
jgi:hypothetical protein